jgi:hypothetical protein
VEIHGDPVCATSAFCPRVQRAALWVTLSSTEEGTIESLL